MVTLRQPYREKVSQMVSWGHWFALFNMLLAMVLGSRYLFVADWPTTLAGRLFSYVSLVGHFSFLVFTSYVLILFPLTFIVVSQRLMRFLSVILATAGMTLLPGTIIATGTPAGVGMGFDPPKFLQSGDVVECTIQDIGTIRNTVR